MGENKTLLALVAVLVLGGAIVYMVSRNNAEVTTPLTEETTVEDQAEEPENTAEDDDVTDEEPAAESTEVELLAVDETVYDQSGTATLTETEDGQVMVILSLNALEGLAAQPAHIHSGACAQPGEVVYPLNDVIEGESQTTLELSMDELMAGKPLLVNVHKSATEIDVYTACGDL